MIFWSAGCAIGLSLAGMGKLVVWTPEFTTTVYLSSVEQRTLNLTGSRRGRGSGRAHSTDHDAELSQSMYRHMVVHCQKGDYDVYIGRPNPKIAGGRNSSWGNPFKIGKHGDRQ